MSYSRILITTSLLLFFSSCIRLSPKPDVLSEEKLSSVLVDIYLNEAQMSISNDSLMREYLQDTMYIKHRFVDIFKKHNITPDYFTKSLLYYNKNVDVLGKIYDDVTVQLALIESNAKVINDSITKIKKDTLSSSKKIIKPIK